MAHRDTDLVIVGDGSDREATGRSGGQIPDRVHFLGWISELETKVQVYNTAECLVLASWREASRAD